MGWGEHPFNIAGQVLLQMGWAHSVRPGLKGYLYPYLSVRCMNMLIASGHGVISSFICFKLRRVDYRKRLVS